MEKTMKYFGIDPGPLKSGVAIIDTAQNCIVGTVIRNESLFNYMETIGNRSQFCIEKISPQGKYGHALFDTIFASGRFFEAAKRDSYNDAIMIDRAEVLRLCPPVYSTKTGKKMGNDAAVRAAMIRYFDGWNMVGIKTHAWQALGVAYATMKKIEIEEELKR